MQNSVDAQTQPCFTPLWISKGSEEELLKLTVRLMLLWKEVTMLITLGGQPIFFRKWKSPRRLTSSNVLVRLMNDNGPPKEHYTFFWQGKSVTETSEHGVRFAVSNTLLSMI